MDINTNQIIDSLQKQLDNHKVDFDVSEVGEVIMVGDGVARVQGLENVLSSEMVELPNGVFGMAMNLEEENVGIVLFGSPAPIPINALRQLKRFGIKLLAIIKILYKY